MFDICVQQTFIDFYWHFKKSFKNRLLSSIQFKYVSQSICLCWTTLLFSLPVSIHSNHNSLSFKQFVHFLHLKNRFLAFHLHFIPLLIVRMKLCLAFIQLSVFYYSFHSLSIDNDRFHSSLDLASTIKGVKDRRSTEIVIDFHYFIQQ